MKSSSSGTVCYFGDLVEIEGGILRRHYFALGARVASREQGTTASLLFYHADHLGSPQVLTDAAGNVVQYIRYAPYGDIRRLFDSQGVPLLPGGAPRSPYVFTDQERDAETGLLYFGARFYDPQLALFLTFDPQAQFDSPYSSTDGNPVNWTDPDGEFVESPPGLSVKWGFGGWWVPPIDDLLSLMGFVGTLPFVYNRDDHEAERRRSDEAQGHIERSWLQYLQFGAVLAIAAVGATTQLPTAVVVGSAIVVGGALVYYSNLAGNLDWSILLEKASDKPPGEPDAGSEEAETKRREQPEKTKTRNISERWKDIQENPGDWKKVDEIPDPRQPRGGQSVREIWENVRTGERIGIHTKTPPGTTSKGGPKHPHPFEP